MGKIGKHAFLKAFYIRRNNNKLSEREEKTNTHTHTVKSSQRQTASAEENLAFTH